MAQALKMILEVSAIKSIFFFFFFFFGHKRCLRGYASLIGCFSSGIANTSCSDIYGAKPGKSKFCFKLYFFPLVVILLASYLPLYIDVHLSFSDYVVRFCSRVALPSDTDWLKPLLIFPCRPCVVQCFLGLLGKESVLQDPLDNPGCVNRPVCVIKGNAIGLRDFVASRIIQL